MRTCVGCIEFHCTTGGARRRKERTRILLSPKGDRIPAMASKPAQRRCPNVEADSYRP